MWQKNWGGNNQDDFFSMLVIEDGGFIAVGYTNSTDIEGLPNKGEYVPVIVKFDKNGNVLWQKNWYGFGSFDSVEQTEDGGFIAVGSSTLNDIEGLTNKGESDAIIVKYDKDGNMLWQKSWGGNKSDDLNNVIETEDGNIMLFGYSESTDIEGLPNKGDEAAIILKYDKDGNMLWQKKSWGGNDEDWINSALLTDDGGFILFGSSNSINIEGIMNHGSFDAIIARYDKYGNMLWQKNWGGSENDGFISMSLTEDGGFIGICESFNLEQTNFDIKIVKYSIEYELENVTNEKGTSIVQQQGKYGVITPTPNKGYEVDKVIIKDKDGNVLNVEVSKLEDGTYSFDLYTDVSVEVIYKEAIENPKTGILDVITIIFVGLFISLSGFFIVKRYNERLEF